MARGNRSDSGGERTAEQREHDRLERERRRAGRAGDAGGELAPTAPPDPATSQPAEEAPLPVEHLPVPAEEEVIAEPVPAVEAHTEAFDTPAVEPFEEPREPTEPPEELEAEPEPESLGSSSRLPPLPPPVRPGGERRGGGRAARAQAEGRGGKLPAPGGGRARRGRRARSAPLAGAREGGRRRLTRARVAALLALAAAVVLVWFLISLFQPFAGSGTGKVIVQIPKGSSSSKIGSILARDDVISSGFFFNLRALLEGKHSSLHSGRFELKHGMSYSAAIDALSKPPPKVIAVKVVIPEGYTRRQIADLVGEDALSGSYLDTTKSSRLLDPRRYGAPAGTHDLEGFLFPATYELTAGAPVQRLVDEQLKAFRERFGAEDKRRAHALGVTPYQLLTVASMIEREAQTEHDRPRIAAVIYNRLREGIPLGIDATIYYAVELQKGIATYTGELTESQLKIDSPYNSRTHKGLPPTPISNPGEASIEAAAHPSHVPYLYYVAGADGCGEQVFSKTYAEFEKNVAAYDAAVKKNGGHPPACKKK